MKSMTETMRRPQDEMGTMSESTKITGSAKGVTSIAPAKLTPNFGKLNPMKGFANLFGVDNLISFGKSLFKLAAMAAVVFGVLRPRAAGLPALTRVDPAAQLRRAPGATRRPACPPRAPCGAG